MKTFRQMRQNLARVVWDTRRNIVKYDGKYAADSSASEFLEVPLRKSECWFARKFDVTVDEKVLDVIDNELLKSTNEKVDC